MNGKRKLIVPVVAIMMCAVALAGVVYAFNSTVVTNDSGMGGDYYTLDIYSDNTAATVTYTPTAVANDVVTFTSETSHKLGNTVVKANSNGAVEIGYVYIKVTAGKGDTPEAIASKLSFDDAIVSTGAQILTYTDSDFTFTYSVRQVTATAPSETLGEPIVADGEGKYAVTTNTVYKVSIMVEFTGSATVGTYTIPPTETPNYNSAYLAVRAVSDDFNTYYKYNVTFSVAPAA